MALGRKYFGCSGTHGFLLTELGVTAGEKQQDEDPVEEA
jgi:hypothetical protein